MNQDIQHSVNHDLKLIHHSATKAKLSNWASSNECVPMAAQPAFGVSITAFFHRGYPFSDPDAYCPYSKEKNIFTFSNPCKKIDFS